MDEAAHRVRGDHPESPEDQEDDEDCPEHGISFLRGAQLRRLTTFLTPLIERVFVIAAFEDSGLSSLPRRLTTPSTTSTSILSAFVPISVRRMPFTFISSATFFTEASLAATAPAASFTVTLLSTFLIPLTDRATCSASPWLGDFATSPVSVAVSPETETEIRRASAPSLSISLAFTDVAWSASETSGATVFSSLASAAGAAERSQVRERAVAR